MPILAIHLLLFLHVLAAIVWVGGMFFAHFCLRPAALETLQPPQRLPLFAGTLRRFFAFVGVSVLVLLATGVVLFAQLAGGTAPLGWHVMGGIGVVMALVFAWIRFALYPVFRSHCANAAWPAAGQALNRIRDLVTLNLALGACALAAVMLLN